MSEEQVHGLYGLCMEFSDLLVSGAVAGREMCTKASGHDGKHSWEEPCPGCGELEPVGVIAGQPQLCRDCALGAMIDQLKCEECGQPIGRNDDTTGLVIWLGWEHAATCSKRGSG